MYPAVMPYGPFEGYRIEDFERWMKAHTSNIDLACTYAAISNHIAALGCLYDEEEDGFVEECLDGWKELLDLLFERITGILKERNIENGTNYKLTGGTHFIVHPFMLENGCEDRNGWWEYPEGYSVYVD